jgi:hypothetical protein
MSEQRAAPESLLPRWTRPSMVKAPDQPARDFPTKEALCSVSGRKTRGGWHCLKSWAIAIRTGKLTERPFQRDPFKMALPAAAGRLQLHAVVLFQHPGQRGRPWESATVALRLRITDLHCAAIARQEPIGFKPVKAEARKPDGFAPIAKADRRAGTAKSEDPNPGAHASDAICARRPRKLHRKNEA